MKKIANHKYTITLTLVLCVSKREQKEILSVSFSIVSQFKGPGDSMEVELTARKKCHLGVWHRFRTGKNLERTV